MPPPKLRAEAHAALFEAGFKVLTLFQQPQRDGRKLDRCVQPSDPWFCYLHNRATPLSADTMLHGEGATAEAAVLDALSELGERSNFGPLEAEIDKLLAVLSALR